MLGYVRTSASQTGLRCLLYPSPSFLSKNQLAKEGPDSVAKVVIPALAPTLDKSLKGDRSLCPVRALRFYLDMTSNLRQNKELVFVSFKKDFDDISPATISSWIKETVILCYELSDQEALILHQVKAHDVRAFAASKAFQLGVSLEQNCDLLPLGSLFFLGLNSTLSSYSQSRPEKKGGGTTLVAFLVTS